MRHFILLYLLCQLVNTSAQEFSRKQQKAGTKYLKNNYTYFTATKGIKCFYISKTEVTNMEYQAFLYSKKKTEDGDDYNSLYPDTSLWLNGTKSGETLSVYYDDHLAYSQSPVVNVSHEQALEYCSWLQGELNKQPHDPNKKYIVDLPTMKEWSYAADELYDTWETPLIDDKLYDKKGQPTCVFNSIHQFNITIQQDSTVIKTDVRAFGTTIQDVQSINPQANGLYHMAGNVAELVKEKGFTKGGGWMDTGHSLLNSSQGTYENNGASINHGFRVMIRLVEV